jgi:uncharacterized protein (TIGR02118 family)
VYKLLILFKHPPDLAEFQTRWSEDFVRLAEQLPGLRRIVVSHTHGGPGGSVEYHLIHEFHFDNLAALTAALASPAGVRAGQCLMGFAREIATLMFAEHMEDKPQ